MVEDIERVIDEVYNVRVKTEQSEKKVLDDTFKLQKACSYEINDNYDDDFDEIDEDLPENDF